MFIVANKFIKFVERVNEDLFEMGINLQEYRKKFHNLERKAGSALFDLKKPKKEGKDYTFHYGGRRELQFNIGLEGAKKDILRYGVAIDLSPGQDIPDPIGTLSPVIEAFNMVSKEEYGDFDLFRNGEKLKEKRIETFKIHDFLFFGKLIEWKEGEITEEEYEDILKTLKDLFPFYKKVMEEVKRMDEYKNGLEPILKMNKQIIITGAPGTGKTYKARNEIAKYLTEGNDFQIRFVQFHPSYDYTDFVEGLKPIKEPDEETIQFKLCNGEFKEFCRIAGLVERIISAGKEVDEKTVKEFLPDNEKAIKFWTDWLNENHNIVRDESSLINNLPPFVFIIDEINRAELSRVFGELFYAIEPDYRGREGRTKTQYSSMVTEETFFIDKNDDFFFVPSNVYIIGTMNEIDRGVEIFDFAIRRRFAWIELKANEVAEDILGSVIEDQGTRQEAKERLNKLNEQIENIPGLNKSFHIGPCYFLKINNYGEEESRWEKLWDFHIEPILREYLRGMGDLEIELEKLRKGYEKNDV